MAFPHITRSARIWATLVGLAAAAPSPAQNEARIVEITGNFTTNAVDLEGSSQLMSVVRWYDSKGTGGIFGAGWSSPLDTRVTKRKDGNVVLTEHGDTHVYFASRIPSDCLEEVVKRLMEAARTAEDVRRPVDEDDLERKFARDGALRETKWLEYARRGLVPEPLDGGSLYRNAAFNDRLQKTPDGFVRIRCNETQDVFNHEGRLVKRIDGGTEVAVDWQETGKIICNDAAAHKLVLEIEASGHVTRAVNENGKTAVFSYDSGGLLSNAQVAGAHTFAYGYTAGLLVRIDQDGKTIDSVEYHGKDQYRSVKKLTRPDIVMTLSFDYSHLDEGHVVVNTLSEKGTVHVTSRHEYFERTMPSGKRRLYRTISTDFKGEVTSTDYNVLGQPTVIRKNGREQRMEYDLFGRVTRKETDASITELIFDPNVKKVSYVRRFDKDSRQVEWSRFSYTALGEVKECSNSDGLALRISYDAPGGKISAFEDQTDAKAVFEYGADEKLSAIALEDHGSNTTVQITAARKLADTDAGQEVGKRVGKMLGELNTMAKLAAVTLEPDEE